jgi:hypothetical protein
MGRMTSASDGVTIGDRANGHRVQGAVALGEKVAFEAGIPVLAKTGADLRALSLHRESFVRDTRDFD